ncbi:MAG: Ig-like domain-containing protein, partial [Bacteroidales bacterium]
MQTIDCNSLNIKSLEGIQYFTSLKELNCSYNDLYSIDVQSNTNLERLYCYQCKLSSIDVSKNLKLKGLGLSSNSLTDLDVSKNLNLENLECDNNDLSSLDISKNTSLYALYCFHNKIRNLDVSTMANPGAVEIYCGDQHDDSNAAITIELTLTLAQKARWEYCLNDDATQNARVHANYKDHVSVTGVTVSPASATLVVDQTRQLTATVSPSDATDKSVSWSSSNSSIASVDQNGLVTAVAAGSATITVTTTDGSKMATCNVTVSQPVTSITISQATATILKGASIQLSATVYPDNADDKSVTWSSSATSVATVDQTGYVTGVAAGSATITVKAKNGVSATSVVNVGTPALATDKGIGTKFSAENGSSLRIFVANSADGSE